MINELDRIVLTDDLPDEKLKIGDVGTVVHVHDQGKAFEVEFFTLDGQTAAVSTVLGTQLRPVSPRDITHARLMEATE